MAIVMVVIGFSFIAPSSCTCDPPDGFLRPHTEGDIHVSGERLPKNYADAVAECQSEGAELMTFEKPEDLFMLDSGQKISVWELTKINVPFCYLAEPSGKLLWTGFKKLDPLCKTFACMGYNDETPVKTQMCLSQISNNSCVVLFSVHSTSKE